MVEPPSADPFWRDRVLRARSMSPAERLLAGARLFDWACESTLAGIRAEHPEANESEVRRILRDRLNRFRRIEESGLFHSLADEAS